MRSILIAGLVAASSGIANAASIDVFKPTASERDSIIVVGCPKCVKAKEDLASEERRMPPGSEIHELREVDGEMMLYTTENWLGGSPVTIVRKARPGDLTRYAKKQDVAPEADLAEALKVRTVAPFIASAGGAPATQPGVDTEAKTGALAASAAPFDPEKFELRTN